MFIKVENLYLNPDHVITVDVTPRGDLYLTTTELNTDDGDVAQSMRHLIQGEEAAALRWWLDHGDHGQIEGPAVDVVARYHCSRGAHVRRAEAPWLCTVCGDYDYAGERAQARRLAAPS